MNLPQNGKIVVIDNEPQEAEPLLEIFGKNRIPYTYFTGEINKLPPEGEYFDDIRLLFLDINLTNGAQAEAIPAQLGNTLKRIIKPGTPYIAAIWSNNQDDHRATLTDLFENREKQISPISMTFLTKSDFFQLEPDHGYVLDPDRPDIINEIQDRIDECLNEVDSAKLFIEWENCIHMSLSKTIFNISNIVDNDIYWNENLRHIYYKLAHAQLEKTIAEHNNQDLQQAALVTLTSSFYDQVEMGISNITITPQIDISTSGKNFYRNINGARVRLLWNNNTYYLYINDVQKDRRGNVDGIQANNTPAEQQIALELKSIYRQISPKLNTELLISKSPKILFHPGNVYRKIVVGRKKRKFLKTYFPKIKDKHGNGNYKINDLSGFQFVELECTPACDYSQSKRLRFRFLPGVLYKTDVEAKLGDLDSIYKEIPPFELNGDIYRLVFDYRLFKAVNKEDDAGFTSDDFLFRLKTELLVDILARVSSHVNRPGIVTVS